ncbi:hypothetical protein FRC08_003694 [Ceratobasidium sp. 394]|nr:hypothetical protein FRC08_003694 [Ceratobasidium sp. 394]
MEVDLGISPAGSTGFDHQDHDGRRVAPRTVKEMVICSEQDGAMDDWIVLKLEDPSHPNTNVWIRFSLHSAGSRGYFTFNSDLAMPANSALRAKLQFDNGIGYQEALDTRAKVSKQSLASHNEHDPAIYASIYAELLSLHIGSGVGRCTPQDLCEIWPSLPDSDRRLQAFYWYEQTDGSGIEYIVLHVVGSSCFSEIQNWWVRLERDGATDLAVISRNRQLVVTPGSKQTRQIVFQDGILFDNVIQVLRDIPTGFNFATEDCWYYASTLAHRLSAEVGDDFFECPTEDLGEIWSGERGAQLFVNRIQWFQGAEDELGYLILNVSATKHGRHGLWARLGQEPLLGSLVDSTCVTRNRKRLLRSDPIMRADITFGELRFGRVTQVLKRLNQNVPSFNASRVFMPAMIVRELTQSPDLVCYWVEGDWGLLSASLP